MNRVNLLKVVCFAIQEVLKSPPSLYSNKQMSNAKIKPEGGLGGTKNILPVTM